MIVTRSWLEEFINISNISTDNICKTLNSIGLEVDSVEKIKIPEGVVVGFVKKCEKHPDADKLSVCQVDIGKEIVQIVCGAKNVAKGQYVPVATVGCVLGSDFKIKKAKLRGVESSGMICSSTEIGLAKLNDGILELDNSIGELKVGRELNEYKLLNDDIIEIELTANRGDCLSINGIARELSTYYNIPLNEFDANINYNEKGIGQILDIKCDSSIESDLVYEAAAIESLELPLLINLRAAITDNYKQKPIETAIKYATHSTGVLLNVYTKAIAKADKNKVILEVNKDKNGFDCVCGEIPLSLIGIEAGLIEKDDSEVILEASYINPEILAQKVFEQGQKTGEVYYRSSRGSEPNLKYGIDYLTTLLSQYGATIYNGSEDLVIERNRHQLNININKVNSIIGQNIEKSKIVAILQSLGFDVKDGDRDNLSVKIPLFRHDIKNIADVTEEIVRIIGIDNIKAKPLAIDEVNRVNKTTYDLIKKNRLRSNAISNGFYETLTYVFTSKEGLEKYGFETVNEKKDILNPISNELNTFRTTMLLNLIEATSNNFKTGIKGMGLFEIGTVFTSSRKELKKVAFTFSGEKENPAVENSGKPKNLDFFGFSRLVSNVIGSFELEPMKKITNDFIHPYQNADILASGKVIGFISKLHPTAANEFDLPDTYIAEIDFDAVKNDLVKVEQYSKFQSSKRDLSIIAPKSMQYLDIKKAINSLKIKEIKQFNLVDVYSDEKLGNNESLTIKFVLQSDNKTLEEEDITTIMDKILKKLDEKLGIGIR